MEEVYRAALTGGRPHLVPMYRMGYEPILELDDQTRAIGYAPTDVGTGASAVQAEDHAAHPVERP